MLIQTIMWANAHRGDRPAEYRWRPLVQRRKVWLTRPTRVPYSNAAKTRNPLKLDGVPQATEPISAAIVGRSAPYCEDTWGRYCCLKSFFFRLSIQSCFGCEDSARQTCAMVRRWRFFASFLRPIFPLSRVQHTSDLRSKFALNSHHV